MESVCGIILAGGQSKRMGNDKTSLTINGKTLVETLLEKLKPSCDTILISSNSDRHHNLDAKVIPDVIRKKGPMGGIYSCLLESSHPLNLVFPADAPNISTKLIEFIITNAHPNKISAVVSPTGFIEPLFATYPNRVLPIMNSFLEKGNHKLIDLINHLGYHPIRLQEGDGIYHPKLLANINTPEDLRQLGRNQGSPKD